MHVYLHNKVSSNQIIVKIKFCKFLTFVKRLYGYEGCTNKVVNTYVYQYRIFTTELKTCIVVLTLLIMISNLVNLQITLCIECYDHELTDK